MGFQSAGGQSTNQLGRAQPGNPLGNAVTNRSNQRQYLADPASYLDFVTKITGGLGVPQSALQRQGADAIGSMLNGPTPEQRALDISLPSLQAMLTGTGPQFERDLALANQQGGRFGSANAILRGEALRNLYNLRNQTAGTIGMLSGSAGQANRGLAQQAFNTGTAQAAQGDVETQRQLQILLQLLGVGQQVAFNEPREQGGGLGGFLGGLGGLALGSFLGPVGAAAGSQVGSNLFGGGSRPPTYGNTWY